MLCACGDVIVEPKWVIGVKGGSAAVFSSLDYGELQEVRVTTETTLPDGGVAEETWQGVYLRDVLNYLGATAYASVTLTAADGTTCAYSPALINAPAVILAVKRDGRELEDQGLSYIQVIAVGQEQNLWLDQLDSITVNE